jgi:4-amino-4-deoxy-L-arabinose transferase-like glycosyltransferase
MTSLKPYQLYCITASLLLIYFGVRLFRVDMLPLFIDETLIIERSVATLQGSPLGFATQGKLLLPWVAALFQPTVAAWWIVRVVTLLLIVPGAAAVVAISKRLHSWHSGWLAILLISLNPILHFHDRLALADTVLHSMLTLLTLFLLWTFDKPNLNWKLAVVSGIFFVLGVLTKSSAAVMLPLPFAAALLLPEKWTLLKRLKGLAWVYGTMFALWMPFQLLLLWRNINFWGRAAQGSTSGALLDLDRILSNLAFVWDGLSGYAHPLYSALMALGIVLVLIFKTRYSLYLLAMSSGYAFALILFGDLLYFRYWIPALPVVLTLATVGYSGLESRTRLAWVTSSLYDREEVIGNTITTHRTIPFGTVILIFVLLLVVQNALPFIYQSYTNPLELALPHLDRQQYIEADSAGTAIPEVAAFLHDSTMPIAGAFPQCYTLQLYLRREVTCLNIAGDEAVRIPRINSELAAIETPFYLVLENRGYVTAAAITGLRLNLAAVFERPGGLVSIGIYEVSR